MRSWYRLSVSYLLNSVAVPSVYFRFTSSLWLKSM
jgi:hypothetical protein